MITKFQVWDTPEGDLILYWIDQTGPWGFWINHGVIRDQCTALEIRGWLADSFYAAEWLNRAVPIPARPFMATWLIEGEPLGHLAFPQPLIGDDL